MKIKKVGLLSVGLIIVGAILYVRQNRQKHRKDGIVIGVLQMASHLALDAARDGFMQELQAKTDMLIEFVVQNAQGSIANAHMIAQSFHKNSKVKAIYAIATPAAQAIASVEKDKPIIIAAVTDSCLVPERDNVCGVTDMIDMQKEIDMVCQFLPQLHTVAVLYNNAEENSITQVNQIKYEFEKKGIIVLEVGISQEADISNAVAMACRKGDALLCPTDNMIASAMELVVNLALKNEKPLFACHNQAVYQGALAARGVDYQECGKQAGDIAYKILFEDKKTGDVPIEKAKTNTIFVNKKTLRLLELSIPEELLNDVVLVETKDA